MHTQVAESGARVIATARDLRKAPGLQALAQRHGRDRLQVVALDVTDAASLQVRPLLVIPYTLAPGICTSLHSGARTAGCRWQGTEGKSTPGPHECRHNGQVAVVWLMHDSFSAP